MFKKFIFVQVSFALKNVWLVKNQVYYITWFNLIKFYQDDNLLYFGKILNLKLKKIDLKN